MWTTQPDFLYCPKQCWLNMDSILPSCHNLSPHLMDSKLYPFSSFARHMHRPHRNLVCMSGHKWVEALWTSQIYEIVLCPKYLVVTHYPIPRESSLFVNRMFSSCFEPVEGPSRNNKENMRCRGLMLSLVFLSYARTFNLLMPFGLHHFMMQIQVIRISI